MHLLAALLVVPLVAVAQSSTSSTSTPTGNSSQVVFTSTSLSTFETLGPSRQLSTGTSTIIILSTSIIAPTQSASSNSTNSTITTGANATTASSTSTTPTTLPTAPSTIANADGNSAPSPGATGGAYGPDDKYIAAAAALLIGTHNGTFHCDEALAVFLLRQINKYRDADLKRTRDPAILDTCNIVVDVGAIYDEGLQRFDHHQRGFTEVFGNGFNTKLSSAGLVYKHFGKEVIANVTQLPSNDEKIETLWLKMYKEFIEAIDAIDNGISQYPNDIKPLYRSRTDLSSRVAALNPAWNQPSDPDTVDRQFAKASQLTGEEFLGKLNYYANAWLPARDILISSVAQSKQNLDPSGKIILFEQFLPWKEHLFELEADQSSGIAPGEATYVVYPDETGGNWRIQAVPVSPESFESRKALPEQWRGLRDEELSKASGIPGGIFVHASGFIGGGFVGPRYQIDVSCVAPGNKTKEGALQIATAALAM
ncbi:hypothetical protein H0H92_012683 [Tricholoma furcatifolium]|nr:hypothetical protein H0H92_012683 [Tricholoma furcatifolium]